MWLQYEYALWQLKRAEGWNAELFILGLKKNPSKNTVIIFSFSLTRKAPEFQKKPCVTQFHSTTERKWFWNFTKPVNDLLELTDLNIKTFWAVS